VTAADTLIHLIHRTATLPPPAHDTAAVRRDQLAAARLELIATATRGDDTSPMLLRHRLDALIEALARHPVDYPVKEQR
jgi:hypothetical protein